MCSRETTEGGYTSLSYFRWAPTSRNMPIIWTNGEISKKYIIFIQYPDYVSIHQKAWSYDQIYNTDMDLAYGYTSLTKYKYPKHCQNVENFHWRIRKHIVLKIIDVLFM